MSAALVIDIILWSSVAAVGFVAFRSGPKVLTASLREGAMDFVNIVPRVAVGVIGSGFIAAVIPQGDRHRLVGAEQRLAWRCERSYRGRGDPGRTGGWLLDRRRCLEGRRRPTSGVGLHHRLGPVCLPAAVVVGNPLHAGPIRVVSGRRLAPIPVSGRRHGHGHRQTLRESERLDGHV